MDALEGTVIRAQSGFYDVETMAGVLHAVLRGVIKKERREEGLVALGDRVRLRRLARDEAGEGRVEAAITEVLPRASKLSRRAPGPKGVWSQHVIVANVDQLLPVFAVRLPKPSLRLLDRFLALAEMDELDSTIVFNKVDLGVSAELAGRIALYEAIGYPVVRASAVTGEGVDELRSALRGRVSAFVGPSGVGKSSLLNRIEPGLGLRVGAVSDALSKGRHTTRVGQLHAVAGGGRVADTPGLRELGIWEVDPGELEWAFVEFRPYLHQCRFHNCTHVHEPGCAVRAAVEGGAIDPERFDSYQKLLAEEE